MAPELVAYEVTNAIWKHEHLLKDLENGKPYVSIFYGLVEAGKIKILTPNEDLMQKSYLIAKRQRITIYDAVFISLAMKLGLPLKSYDRVQIRALKSENDSILISSRRMSTKEELKEGEEVTGRKASDVSHLRGTYPFKDLQHEKDEMKHGWA